jgi:hypothetical protein
VFHPRNSSLPIWIHSPDKKELSLLLPSRMNSKCFKRSHSTCCTTTEATRTPPREFMENRPDHRNLLTKSSNSTLEVMKTSMLIWMIRAWSAPSSLSLNLKSKYISPNYLRNCIWWSHSSLLQKRLFSNSSLLQSISMSSQDYVKHGSSSTELKISLWMKNYIEEHALLKEDQKVNYLSVRTDSLVKNARWGKYS